MAAGHEIHMDSWHCTEELAPRLADITQLMSRLHCDETGWDIHCSVEPIQVEALQHQP